MKNNKVIYIILAAILAISIAILGINIGIWASSNKDRNIKISDIKSTPKASKELNGVTIEINDIKASGSNVTICYAIKNINQMKIAPLFESAYFLDKSDNGLLQGIAQYNTLEGNGLFKNQGLEGFLTFTSANNLGNTEGNEKLELKEIKGTYEIGIPILTTSGVIEMKVEISI
ncbi:MAG: hypothetical protein RR620_08845 [Clostridium sp.]